MEQITESLPDAAESRLERAPRHNPECKREHRWLLYSGIFCLTGGALAPVLGSLLTALSWLIGNHQRSNVLHRLGSVFLISTIPLLMIAGFCLDAYEKRSRRIDPGW